MLRQLSGLRIAASIALLGCGGGSGSTGPSTLSVTVPVSPIASGTSVQATATVIDGSGHGTPASNVTWSSKDPGIAEVTSTGLITGAVKGSTIITARSGTLTGTLNVAVIPGQPVSIVIVSGNGQTATHGNTLPDPLCTSVLDGRGNQIVGVTVNYTVATGGGSLAEPKSPPTDAGGIAISGHWTLGPGTGPQTVTASTSVGSVTFTATAQ